jgi:hypothetical protein
MFYPGTRIQIRPLLHPGSGSRIRGVKKHRIPDPSSFFIKAINKFCLLIPDPDPTIAPSRIRIPDPGGEKAPVPQHCPNLNNYIFVVFLLKSNVFITAQSFFTKYGIRIYFAILNVKFP